jgi:hypothetical protein
VSADGVTREELIEAATHLHDETGCQCDPKYLMSCPNMANATLQAGRVIRARRASDAPEPQRSPEPRPLSRPCERHDFAGHPVGATCPECGHMIMAHVGTESCVVCRMEYQLSPNYRRQQQRIHGVHPRDTW